MVRFKYILFLLIVSMAGSGFAQEGMRVVGTRPALEFSETEYDFGTLTTDSVITHVFAFKNVSFDTIKIEKVGTSWGCTGSLLSSEEIAPGEAGELKITFRSHGRHGKQSKRITVYTDDTVQAVYRLYLRGEILREEQSE